MNFNCEITGLLEACAHAPEFGRGAPASDIRGAEAQLEVRFPTSYRRFLEGLGWLVVGHLEIQGLGADVPFHLNLVKTALRERTEATPRLPSRLVPLLNDGAGNHYCLDTSAERLGEAPVVLWCHDLPANQKPVFVEQNFIAWLRSEIRALGELG